MSKSIPLLRPRTLTPRAFWLGVGAIVLLRLGLTGFQQAYTWVGGAPLDDELMFRAANAITAGEWLGAYDYLTLSKAMFFPVWLALLHALHIPYLLGGAALWLAACGLATAALWPLWRPLGDARARAWGLFCFGALAFLPSSWASYTLRVYRDNIFPALCLLLVAGLAGAALRARDPKARQWPWLLAAGLGLACAYLDREDAGLFLLPFAVVATGITVFLLARQRRWLCCAAHGIPYALLAAGVLTFCALNQSHYGVFALSDFSEGSFADAMGAMMRVDTESDEPLLSVPADARALLYEAVPELQPLAYWLEEDPQLQNDFRDPELDDYRAGSFYWAIRRAAQFEGIYETAATADAYWSGVAEAVNAACADGTLPARTGERSATNQPVRAEYVVPTIKEAAKSLCWVLNFEACSPSESLRSIGTVEDIAQWSEYLHCSFNAAAEAGKDTPYYSPAQRAAYVVLGALRSVYALAFWMAFAWAVYCQVRATVRLRRDPERRLPWLLALGLLGLAALRCGMIAFVEVSSFGIGTSTMYLATVHPLLALYCFAAVGLNRKREELPHVET